MVLTNSRTSWTLSSGLERGTSSCASLRCVSHAGREKETAGLEKLIVLAAQYMPFDGNRWKPEKLVPYQQLLRTIEEKYGPLEKLEDDANDTSKHYRAPGHIGSIGFITRYVGCKVLASKDHD